MPLKKELDGTADGVQRPEKLKEEEKPVQEGINAKGDNIPESPVWEHENATWVANEVAPDVKSPADDPWPRTKEKERGRKVSIALDRF